MQISETPAFSRAFKKTEKKNPAIRGTFNERLLLFEQNPFDSRLHTHKLIGNLKGYWSFSLEYDCRVIFLWHEAEKVVLFDIGSHDEVY